MRSKAKLIIVAAVAIRFTLALLSYGSNDMYIWTGFAESIRESGLWQLYVDEPLFNHPPLVAMLAAGLHRFAEMTALPFPVLWKIPVIAGDVAVLIVLWKQLAPRSEGKALIAMAVFAFNPVSILLAGHHGNTDGLGAALVVVAVHFHRREKFTHAGLAIAAAVNVKLIAALCVPALLLLLRTRRDALAMMAGGVVGLAPFAVALWNVAPAFVDNVVFYDAQFDLWGFGALVFAFERLPGIDGGRAVFGVVAPLVLFATLIWLARAGRQRRWDPCTAALASVLAFLVFADGWGIQYLVWVVPILALHSTVESAKFALAGGLYAVLVYSHFAIDYSPIVTWHKPGAGFFNLLVGLVPWSLLAGLLWRIAQRAPDAETPEQKTPEQKTPEQKTQEQKTQKARPQGVEPDPLVRR